MATSVVALVAAIVLFPLCPNSASAALNPCRNGNLTGLKLANIVRNLSGHVNSLNNSPTDSVFTEGFLSGVDCFFKVVEMNVNNGNLPTNHVIGSTLLRVVDNYALNNFNTSTRLGARRDEVRNTVILVREVKVTSRTVNETLSLIESENASISIPREVFSVVKERTLIRVASTLFRNMTGCLPERISQGKAGKGLISRLASPVISASVQCENCTISNLTNPVEVVFAHTPYDKALLRSDPEGLMKCVFWKFGKSEGDPLLIPGNWSEDGCNTTFNFTSTVCKCNHLTHFAILLSARPLQQTLALQVIGYIGVAVSLVAMAAVVFVFVFLKPLRTMRNYIHIQLCISLGIAQVIFVAGIEPRLSEGGGVPVGCRLVAVLLHYWFLVSFMWMLMEGVVLYVVLVRVFIKYHGRYIAAFTIASYGLPLLYVCGLTVPLGFIRTDGFRQNQTYDYGYKEACYLNPESGFMWSIIAPVILIFIANIGFFIMAVVIMYSHQKRQHTEKKAHKIKHWLKVSTSLTVVMGITWIIGVLVIEVEALLPLAYIFTIFVAFQGLFIFVIFVLLSKQVRENYTKWWKSKNMPGLDFFSRHFGDKSFTTAKATTLQKDSIGSGKPPSGEQPSTKDSTHSRTTENSYLDHKPSTTSLSLSYTSDTKDLLEPDIATVDIITSSVAPVFISDNEGQLYSNSMYYESKK